MVITENRSLDLIAAEAADWFTAIRTGELSREEREQFAAWLEASPVHVGEYLGIAEIWGILLGARPWPAQSAEELIDATRAAPTNVVALAPAAARAATPPPSARTRQRLVASAAAVAVLLVSALLVTFGPEDLFGGERYATARGEQRSIVLADGSIVQLNTLSRLVVHFSDRERRLELAEGEAFFRVAHDPTRPFRVVTPLATVRAIGTEFNVYSRKQRMHVAVVEGRVQVMSRAGAAAAANANPPDRLPPSGLTATDTLATGVALGPRESLEIESGGGVVRKTASRPDQTTAWMQRRLVFDDERLDRVVEEFNRYNAHQLAVNDPALAALRISAVFDADDPGALVDYLNRIQQVQISVRGEATLLAPTPRAEVQ